MDDIYAALIGEPPTEQEKLQALAAKLRNRSQLGQLGMLTGDKILAPMGAGIGKQTEEQAGQIGQWTSNIRNREANAQLARDAQAARAAEGQFDRDFTKEQNALERALKRELEGMQQARYGAADKKLEAAEEKLLQKDTISYGKALGAAGIPELRKGINDANKVLSTYEGKGIPGVFPGMGMVPNIMKGEEGRKVTTALQGVKNVLLRARSGAAVTEQEYERLQDEMFGAGATDQSFREAWQYLQNKVEAAESSLAGAYGPDVVNRYTIQRQRATPYDVLAAGGTAAPAGTATPAEDPNRILTPAEWKARKAGAK
jgi:hypothetical protein